MWHKAIWKGHPMRLELTHVGLLAELANHYTTRGAFGAWNIDQEILIFKIKLFYWNTKFKEFCTSFSISSRQFQCFPDLKKIGQKTAITKSPSLSTVKQINDTWNTDGEILVFKDLKTIERPKPQNLNSLSLYNTHRYSYVYINLPAFIYYIRKDSDCPSNYYN